MKRAKSRGWNISPIHSGNMFIFRPDIVKALVRGYRNDRGHYVSTGLHYLQGKCLQPVAKDNKLVEILQICIRKVALVYSNTGTGSFCWLVQEGKPVDVPWEITILPPMLGGALPPTQETLLWKEICTGNSQMLKHQVFSIQVFLVSPS